MWGLSDTNSETSAYLKSHDPYIFVKENITKETRLNMQRNSDTRIHLHTFSTNCRTVLIKTKNTYNDLNDNLIFNIQTTRERPENMNVSLHHIKEGSWIWWRWNLFSKQRNSMNYLSCREFLGSRFERLLQFYRWGKYFSAQATPLCSLCDRSVHSSAFPSHHQLHNPPGQKNVKDFQYDEIIWS